jgi:hypothetical protein
VKRVLLIVGMAVTCVLAAVANVVIARLIGVNLFTITIWLIIPAGAIIFGMLGTSGAILAARYLNIHPNLFDLLPMVLLAVATMLSIYYLDYLTLVLDDGARVSTLIGFYDYVDLVLTKGHIRVGRAGQQDFGEAGHIGYWLAVAQFVGFLVGGAATFGLIRALERCSDCGFYLRKLKSKTTRPLTFDETEQLLHFFKESDLVTLKEVISWAPQQRKLDPPNATIIYSLYRCPKCKSETIIAMAKVYSGKDWQDIPSLSARRVVDPGNSLRGAFG